MAETGGRTQHVDEHLVGRAAEQAILDGVLEQVEGGATTLVVSGDAGVGKSALLRWLGARAHERGFVLVTAGGVELEEGLAFSALNALLWPVRTTLDIVPDAMRRSLKVAIGWEDGDASELATNTATLAILSLMAEASPVLVVIDDAQWIDEASLRALVFAARRAGADRVAIVFGRRTGIASPLDRTDFPCLEIGPLADDAARHLLGRYAMAPAVIRLLAERSGGNPLALVAAATMLTERQRAGDEPLPALLPTPRRLVRAFDHRLSSLPPRTIQALGFAALEVGNDAELVVSALDALGLSRSDLAAAEQHGLVEVVPGSPPSIAWSHPLLRSAVHERSTPDQRRMWHAALADATLAAGRHEQALWHISEASVGPDDDLAAHLDALATRARRRGALEVAAVTYRRAAALTTGRDGRLVRLLGAADASWASGDFGGVMTTLMPLTADFGDHDRWVAAEALLAQAELWTVGPHAAIDRLEYHAARPHTAPGTAATLLFHATVAHMISLNAAAATKTARRAAAFATVSGDAILSYAARGVEDVVALFAAANRPEGTSTLVEMAELATVSVADGGEMVYDLAQIVAYALAGCERWRESISLSRAVIRSAETAGLIGRASSARVVLADALWRTGHWAEALAEVSQAVGLLDDARPGQLIPASRAVLARIEAGVGQAEGSKRHAVDVIDSPLQMEMFTAMAYSARGLLHLGAGRHADAALAFDQVADRTRGARSQTWLWWLCDAVEAYAGCGRARDARTLLDTVPDDDHGQWSGAAKARSWAVLDESNPARDVELESAADAFRAIDARFDEARTLLLLGQRRLGRGERERGSRDVAAARTLFDRLGARPWSAAATDVLGGTSPVQNALTSLLTHAELRVALVVGRGATNRQAADALCLSPKTVDTHLGHIYQKLAIANRAQLARLTADLTDDAALGFAAGTGQRAEIR